MSEAGHNLAAEPDTPKSKPSSVTSAHTKKNTSGLDITENTLQRPAVASDSPKSKAEFIAEEGLGVKEEEEEEDAEDFIWPLLHSLLRVGSIQMGVTNPVDRYMTRYHRDVVIESRYDDPWEAFGMSVKRSKLKEHYGTLLDKDRQSSENAKHKDDYIKELYKQLISGNSEQFSAQNSFGWEKLVHPDGQLYFRNQILHDDFVFITDTNMLDQRNRLLVTGAAHYLKRRLNGLRLKSNDSKATTCRTENVKKENSAGSGVRKSEEVAHHMQLGSCDVFVSMVLVDEEIRFEHYVVNRTRNPTGLFCIRDADVEVINYPHVQSVSHLSILLEAQYWTHTFFFPHGKILEEDDFRSLHEMLLYSSIESLLYSDSITPFASEKVQKLADLAEKMKEHHDNEHTHEEGKAYVIASVAQMQSALYRTRFRNLYGQHNARLSRAQRIKKTYAGQQSVFWTIVFFAQYSYQRQLESTWLSKVKDEDWKPFLRSLVEDWQQIVINSAVLLNANVAFLAVPGVTPVPPDNERPTQRMSVEQIACYLSIVTSLCSVLTGLILLKRNSAELGRWEERLQKYVSCYDDPHTGIHAIAFIYSIPYVLLLWSTGFFVFSVAKVSFGFIPRSTLQLSIFSCLWFFLSLISLWVIFNDFSPTVFNRIQAFTRALVRVPHKVKSAWRETKLAHFFHSIAEFSRRINLKTRRDDIEIGRRPADLDSEEMEMGDRAESYRSATNKHTSRSRRGFRGGD